MLKLVWFLFENVWFFMLKKCVYDLEAAAAAADPLARLFVWWLMGVGQ